MEIRPGDIERGEFKIEAFCSGDGERRIAPSDLYGAMLLAYLLPIFLLFWLNSLIGALNSSRRVVSRPAAQAPAWVNAIGMPSLNVTVTSADAKLASETVALVREALSDGVITSEELARIQAKVSGLATDGDMRSLTARLTELKDAYEQGLITSAEYDSKRREILDNA